ncbi:MAG: hypothetical protein SNJ73_08905 [Acetobacteraceae bacterium]
MSLFERTHQTSSVSGDQVVLCVECDDLEAAVTAVQQSGFVVTPIQARADWGIRVAYFRGTGGILVELNSPMPKDQWSDDLVQESSPYDQP